MIQHSAIAYPERLAQGFRFVKIVPRKLQLLLRAGRRAEYCDERICVFLVSLCVCPRVYLRNYTSDKLVFTNFFVHVTYSMGLIVTRSISGGVAIRYVLPVIWMTSYLYIMGYI